MSSSIFCHSLNLKQLTLSHWCKSLSSRHIQPSQVTLLFWSMRSPLPLSEFPHFESYLVFPLIHFYVLNLATLILWICTHLMNILLLNSPTFSTSHNTPSHFIHPTILLWFIIINLTISNCITPKGNINIVNSVFTTYCLHNFKIQMSVGNFWVKIIPPLSFFLKIWLGGSLFHLHLCLQYNQVNS